MVVIEEQDWSAKVYVGWDLKNWDDDYKDVDPRQIKDNICSALDAKGYDGPVSIFCYATKIPQHVEKDFSTAGISIRLYPQDSDKMDRVEAAVPKLDAEIDSYADSDMENADSDGENADSEMENADSDADSDGENADSYADSVDELDWDAHSGAGAGKLSVWWNLENGDLYNGCTRREIKRIKHNLYSKLKEKKCHGTLSIFCYGNTIKIPSSVQRSLLSITSRIIPYPEVMKDTIYTNIIVDMLIWAKDNPPPATLFLVLDDDQISNVIDHLRERHYAIHVVQGKDLLAGGPSLSKGESQQLGDSLLPSDSDKINGVEAVPKVDVEKILLQVSKSRNTFSL